MYFPPGLRPQKKPHLCCSQRVNSPGWKEQPYTSTTGNDAIGLERDRVRQARTIVLDGHQLRSRPDRSVKKEDGAGTRSLWGASVSLRFQRRSGFRFYGPGDGAGLAGRPECSALASGPVTAAIMARSPGTALEGRFPGE